MLLLVFVSGCARSLNEIELIETNKVTVPSWVGMHTNKIYWSSEQLNFVAQRDSLENLALGVVQTENLAKMSFAREAFKRLMSDLKNILVQKSDIKDERHLWIECQTILESVISSTMLKNIEIADIYYRTWIKADENFEISTQVMILCNLNFGYWVDMKSKFKKALMASSTLKLHALAKEL